MDTPVEIVSTTCRPRRRQQEIRDRVEKLDRMYNHLIGSAFGRALPAHRTGNVYGCISSCAYRARMSWPAAKPHHARERYSDPDVNGALRDAFKTAERRLVEFKRKQRGDVKVHETISSLSARCPALPRTRTTASF